MTAVTPDALPPAAPPAAAPEAVVAVVPSRRTVRRALSLLAAAAVLAGVAFVGYWALTGGRWFVVRTPSMGQAAPVGTLLWVHPVNASDVHVGEMITFRPPGISTTYSHRIKAIAPDGTIMTKGDANAAADPWRITTDDIVGKVDARWWGAGWLARAAPLLIIGALLLWFGIGRFARRHWRLPLRVVAASLLVSIAIFVYRPLVGADQLSLVPTDPGVEATYVSTGLLPLDLKAENGNHVRLISGQVGTVHSDDGGRNGRISVTLTPRIVWWWWLVLVAICLSPALWTSFSGLAVRRLRPAVA